MEILATGTRADAVNRMFPAASFPDRTKIPPELLTLAYLNYQWLATTAAPDGTPKTHPGPQSPRIGATACAGDMRLNSILDISELGRVFIVQERGGFSALGSQNYGVSHLYGPGGALSLRLWITIGHRCLRNNTCREGIPKIETSTWMRGIERIEIPYRELKLPVREEDREHIRNISAHALSQSSDIREAVRSGRMLIADVYMDNDTGKIQILAVWAAAHHKTPVDNHRDPEINVATLACIANGLQIKVRNDSLQRLQDCVEGNYRYVERRQSQAVKPLGLKVSTCADSRGFLEQAYCGPHTGTRGDIELGKSAGLEITERVVDGYARFVTHSQEQLRTAEAVNQRSRLVFVGHSDCGANKAALKIARSKDLSQLEPTSCDPGTVENLATTLSRRFRDEYLKEHPSDGTDIRLLHAAKVGAIGAAREMWEMRTPATEELIEHFIKGHLAVSTGVAYLTSGFVEFGPDIGPTEARINEHRRGPHNKTLSLPQLRTKNE